MIVVDASVVVAGYLREAVSPQADAVLATGPVVAPELVLGEFGNALWRAQRMGRATPEQAAAAMRRLPAQFERLFGLAALADAALALALRRDHPVYDCFYVALALREGAPLVTADRRLAERFAGDAEIRLLAA